MVGEGFGGKSDGLVRRDIAMFVSQRFQQGAKALGSFCGGTQQASSCICGGYCTGGEWGKCVGEVVRRVSRSVMSLLVVRLVGGGG